MKIGIDIRVLMDEYYSGVSQYAANLLAALLALDSKNEYKLFYNSWHNQDKLKKAWTRANAEVIGRRWPNKLFNYFGQKILSRPRIDRVLGGVDVFWSPHFNFTSLSTNPKKIITVHDLSFLRYPEFFNARKNFWHRALNVRKTLLSADKIIAVSENTKRDIVELVGVAPEKIETIYSGNNAVKREISKEEKEALFSCHNISGRFILYLGTIEPRKNITGLIQAYNYLRKNNPALSDVKLVLAGGNGWKSSPIYKERGKSEFKNDIIFLGYISQKDKEILLSQASIFAYPSFYEGFGFPPLEAMAYGVPVVCSDVSSLPEVVGDAALAVDPASPEKIAAALILVLSDEELRQRLIDKGRVRAGYFSWEETAKKYLAVFENTHI